MSPSHRFLAAVCLPLLLQVSASSAAGDTLQPLAELDVFQLEYASDPQISPDGERVVYVRNSMSVMKDRRQTRLWLVDDDGSNHRRLGPGELQESSPRWSPDGRQIAFVARTEEGSEIFVHWIEEGQTSRLTQLPRTPGGLAFSPDGQWLAFSMLVPEKPPKLVEPPTKPEGAEWADPPRVIERVKHEADGRGHLETGFHHLFVLPVEGGTPRQVTHGDFQHEGAPRWTPDGEALIFSANRDPDWEYSFVDSEVYAVSLADGTIRALTDRNGPDRDPVVSPDGSRIAYASYEDRVQTYQVADLFVMNADGGGKRSLTGELDRSVSAPLWSPAGGRIFFRYEDRGRTKIAAVDLEGRREELVDDLGGTSLGRPYPGGSFTVARDGRSLAYVAIDPAGQRPGDVAIWRDGRGSRRLTDLNRDLLDHRELGEVEEIWWKSSHDGIDIQGWIVKPPGFDPATKYPLLMEIHGGPITNYGPRFAAEIQLYAAAGYVVFYANPRGSTGYGQAFGNLLHHDYPGNDYDDLMSGIDAVLARGYVDPERLYVTGGSAGGILTAWIVGKTERFRAAAVVKPVINWYSKVLVADNYYYYHDYRYPGSPWENPETYHQYSPISRVADIETPTLVMVGTADLRTPLSESKQLYHALKLRRIDTALVEIPGAAHNIAARPSQLIAKVAHVLAWFERYP